MALKVTCKKCGLSFEGSDLGKVRAISCPGCMSSIALDNVSDSVELGKYRLLNLLGQGGMGQVFRAVNPEGVQVAVKVMAQDLMESVELVERFRREMAYMSSMNHENIVRVFDQGETTDSIFFVMELVEGDTLRNILRHSPLDESQIANVSIQVLKALGYAHSKGIVHRDIKPENIMFDKKGRIKVTDFGLARKSALSSGTQDSLTGVNSYLGTESYMSPEQKINPKSVTHKSDIYSWGVVLYEMLTGSLPMGLFQPPSCQKNIGEIWDSLCFRMLDINPELRPNHCQAIIDEIEKYFGWQEKPKGTPGQSPAQKGQPEAPASQPADSLPPKSQAPAEDLLKKEGARIKAHSEKIINAAHEFCQGNKFQEALPLWLQALETVDNAEDRANIQQWIDFCKDKIEAKDQASFLCPGCHKVFSKKPEEMEKTSEKFSCPKCNCRLKYDTTRKQVKLFDQAPPAKPAPLQDQRPETNSTDSASRSAKEMPASTKMLPVLLVIVATDWMEPDMFNGVIEWFEAIPALGNLPLPWPTLAGNIRFFIQLVTIFLAIKPMLRLFRFFFDNENRL